MALYPPLPSSRPSSPRPPSPFRPFPSGRYAHTDPLRRLFGLSLLAEPLPEPLRARLIRAWMQPRRFDGNQAIQSRHRQRPDEAGLLFFPPWRLGNLAQIELEVSRRVVEMSRNDMKREERKKLLSSQGVYLNCLYAALAARIGEAAALAEFERLLLASA